MVSEDSTYELLARNCFHYGNSGTMGRLPSLKALRAFDAVARLNSVKAAADELCVTPSAVSRQISSLEDDIGAALLKPDGRGCCLTADGRLLERGLEGIFTRVAEAVDRVRRPVSGTQVRVCAGVMFASAWLIPRLDRFNSVAPDTEIILTDLNGFANWSGQADVVIDWGMAKNDTRVVAERLSDNEEIFPVCRPGICQSERLAGATLLHLEHTERSWHWPEWSAFLAAVNLSHIPIRAATVCPQGFSGEPCVAARGWRCRAPRSPVTTSGQAISCAPSPRALRPTTAIGPRHCGPRSTGRRSGPSEAGWLTNWRPAIETVTGGTRTTKVSNSPPNDT